MFILDFLKKKKKTQTQNVDFILYFLYILTNHLSYIIYSYVIKKKKVKIKIANCTSKIYRKFYSKTKPANEDSLFIFDLFYFTPCSITFTR